MSADRSGSTRSAADVGQRPAAIGWDQVEDVARARREQLERPARSRKTVPMSVELIRFWMSLVDCACSSILTFSSWLTVRSSSLTDCSSSLLVSSSSVAERSSSLIACSSSFDAFSSSAWVSYCSMVAAQLRLAAVPASSSSCRAGSRGRDRDRRRRVGRRSGSGFLEQHEEEAARRVVLAQHRPDRQVRPRDAAVVGVAASGLRPRRWCAAAAAWYSAVRSSSRSSGRTAFSRLCDGSPPANCRYRPARAERCTMSCPR